MKKPKKPGENISLKTKKNESSFIIDWINSQTNLMDSIRYLIENEVMQNGVRNLQNHIPAERVISLNSGHPAVDYSPAVTADAPHAEVAATIEKPSPSDLKPLRRVDLISPHSGTQKEMEKQAEDDEIDEEDIESWF